MITLINRWLRGDQPPLIYNAKVQMPQMRWKKVTLPGGGVVYRVPEHGDTAPLPRDVKARVPTVRSCPRCKGLNEVRASWCDQCGWKLSMPWDSGLWVKGINNNE